MIVPATPDEIARAAERLRRGELVAFPTETVYGLGADAANPEAVARVYRAKGRPSGHPLIVHLAEGAALEAWASEVPHPVRRLGERFWPGPLTVILPRRAGVAEVAAGGQPTIGLRVPAHPVAQALLRAFGGGLAAPSANPFGRISPTTAAHVEQAFPDVLVLDGGACGVGLESTIVDFTAGEARILRPGRIDAAALEAVLGYAPPVVARSAVRAPGTLARHYAPQTPTFLVERAAPGADEGVLARRPRPPGAEGVWLVLPDDPEGYARHLYAALRAADARGLRTLWVEAVPEDEAWLAVRDRLARAALPPPFDRHGSGSAEGENASGPTDGIPAAP